MGRVLAETDHHPFATDTAIAAAFVLFGWLSIALDGDRSQTGLTPTAALGVVLVVVPLAWRRRAPLAALATLTLALVPYNIAGLPNNLWYGNAWLLAAYTAGVYGEGRWRDPIRLASTALLIGSFFYGLLVLSPTAVAPAGVLENLLAVAANSAFVVWIWLLGDATRLRRLGERELAERTAQLERERAASAHRAVLDERIRIARELHDVVAHHVSLMGIQAGAARRVLATRPRQAEQTLTTIEATSREAVRELHRLLGFLRHEQEEHPLTPQPGLRHLDALLTQVREAGLPVTLAVEGHERPVPPAVDLSAYRITQEALTNTLRHAGPTAASVTLRYRERVLEVEVADEGRKAAANGHETGPGGNGILGMRERAGLLGGRLRAESRPGRGFIVEASLPFDGEPA